jgi:hypothetical protein
VIKRQIAVHPFSHSGRPVTITRQTAQQGNSHAENGQRHGQQAQGAAKRSKDAGHHVAIRECLAAGKVVGAISRTWRLQGCQTRAGYVLRMDRLSQTTSLAE